MYANFVVYYLATNFHVVSKLTDISLNPQCSPFAKDLLLFHWVLFYQVTPDSDLTNLIYAASVLSFSLFLKFS
jgi:hypothetical protein